MQFISLRAKAQKGEEEWEILRWGSIKPGVTQKLKATLEYSVLAMLLHTSGCTLASLLPCLILCVVLGWMEMFELIARKKDIMEWTRVLSFSQMRFTFSLVIILIIN